MSTMDSSKPANPVGRAPDADTLRYRRQFLLGPRYLEGFPCWKRTHLDAQHYLTSHPDLELTLRREGQCWITLLGYLIDPRDPHADNRSLVAWLVKQLASIGIDGVFRETDRLGGRWVIIAQQAGRCEVFHDLAGSRPLYYAPDGHHSPSTVWCGSSPGLIGEAIPLRADPEAAALIERSVQEMRQPWIAGTATGFRDLRIVLPNHALCLETGAVRRFWPNVPRSVLPLQHAATSCAHLLAGIVAGLDHRHGILLPITAGYDSRLILAACKPFRDRLRCYTHINYDKTLNSPDLRVPRTMLADLGMEHRVVRYPESMRPALRQTIEANVAQVRRMTGNQVQMLLDEGLSGSVSLRGTATEIAKLYYEAFRRSEEPVTVDRLIRVAKLPATPCLQVELASWLEQLSGKTCGYHLLDLFYWEHRVGRWASTGFSGLDLVQETCSPYSREIIARMLGVEDALRGPPKYRLHREIVRALWPELLNYPFNPPASRACTILARLRNAWHTIGLNKRRGA